MRKLMRSSVIGFMSVCMCLGAELALAKDGSKAPSKPPAQGQVIEPFQWDAIATRKRIEAYVIVQKKRKKALLKSVDGNRALAERKWHEQGWESGRLSLYVLDQCEGIIAAGVNGTPGKSGARPTAEELQMRVDGVLRDCVSLVMSRLKAAAANDGATNKKLKLRERTSGTSDTDLLDDEDTREDSIVEEITQKYVRHTCLGNLRRTVIPFPTGACDEFKIVLVTKVKNSARSLLRIHPEYNSAQWERAVDEVRERTKEAMASEGFGVQIDKAFRDAKMDRVGGEEDSEDDPDVSD